MMTTSISSTLLNAPRRMRFSEAAFDLVEPELGCRREMHLEMGVLGQLGLAGVNRSMACRRLSHFW
jgi:hypothetical protein